MPNPFVENDEDIQEEVQQEEAIEKQAANIVELADESVEVPFDDEPEELEEERKPTRMEKKRNRFREAHERADRAEARAEVLEQELQRLRNQPVQQQYVAPQPQEDPLQKELDEVYESQTQLQEAFAAKTQNNTLTAEEHKEMLSRARKLDERKQKLIATQAIRETGVSQQNPNQTMQQMLHARYFDLAQNPSAYRWAFGRLQQRLAEGANNNDLSVMDEIADEARAKWRIGRYRNGAPPSDATRARHTGVPAGMTAAPKERPRGIKMTKEYKQLAMSMFPSLPEKEAYSKWANTVGKRLVQGDDRHDR